ncbi:MAG TPA: TIGR01777 family oxidoreductase [Polyangiaceae bacterium]|nr:TIGR01777 family oxidoreductase [Polyangiaceae bacterium]
MRILLTGGTGFIGSALARALRERRDDVVIVSRGHNGDVTWDGIDAEVGRVDAVVHLAGEPVAGGRWTAARLERIRTSRVDTTALIAKAIERAAHKPRVMVSASAVGIYGTRLDDEVLDESAPPADDPLARVCVAWEAAAQPARQAGVRVVHPRIGVALGRGGGVLAKMTAPFKWFVGGPLGSGAQWMSWVHQRDVVRAILFAIGDATLDGPVNVVAPGPVTMDDFARSLGRAMARPAAVRAPAFALRLALGEGLAQVVLTGQRVVPRKLERAGFRFQFPELGDALAELYADHRVAR